MIRRNHIQPVPKMNFDQPSIRPRQNYQDNSVAKRQSCKLELESAMDQNNRLTSNKKYHQYKNWKEEQHKSVNVWREEEYPMTKPIGALKENIQPQKDETKLNRLYNYDSNQPLKIDYSSIKISKPNRIHPQPVNMQKFQSPLNVGQENMNQIRLPKSGKISHNVSIDNSVCNQSPKHKNSYQSSQKYGQQSMVTYKQAKPLPFFESTQISMDRKCFAQKSISKVQKNNYHGIERGYNADEGQNENQSIQLRSCRQKQINSTFGHHRSVSKHTGQGKTQVSDKLKMISEFNDQINERIKKIIVCFQGLKQKL